MSGHTATPWFINVSAGPTQIAAVEPFKDIGCCFVPSGEGRKNTGTANAAFIVTACNSHAALVKALEEIRGGSFDGASTLAVNGSWQLMVERLQKIADEALATLTARKVG